MLKVNSKVNSSVYFTNNKKQEQKYKDPLMNWPVRGLAYSNELGAALSEIAPKLGILLWFPAMLYFGADIYDKYKNEKTSFDPSTQRGTEQAIFQLLASVILPTAAVLTGQAVASSMGAMGKTKLSLQTQEDTMNFLQEFASKKHIEKYLNNKDAYKADFEESLTIKRNKLIRERKLKNPIQYLNDNLFNKRNAGNMAKSRKDLILNYANEQIDDMFRFYDDLIEGRRPQEFTDSMWKTFKRLKKKFAKDPDYKNTYLREAAEVAIKKYQKSQITKHKLLKTLGGFIALGLAIKPIDEFVKNVIIKKYIKPNINNAFEKAAVKKYKTDKLG